MSHTQPTQTNGTIPHHTIQQTNTPGNTTATHLHTNNKQTSSVESQTDVLYNHTKPPTHKQPSTQKSIHLTAINPRQSTSPVISHTTHTQSPTLCSISSPTQTHVHDDTCVLDHYDYNLDDTHDTDDTDSTIDLSEYNVDTDENIDELDSVGVVICGADKSITHINDAFTRITGYSTSDLLGRPSLSLLQGQDTSVQAVSTIRSAINNQASCKVCLINYRKDGQPFWNLLTILPMLNKQNNTVDAWIGIQRLHQPRPYVDKLLKMFPWTQQLPRNVNNYNRRRRAAIRQHNQLLLQNNTHKQNNQSRSVHRHNPLTLPSHSDTTNGDTLQSPSINATDTSTRIVHPILNSLQQPSIHRYSSVDDATDGEQDIYDIDELLDNKYLAHPTTVTFISETDLPTQQGTFKVRAYKDDAQVHAADGHSYLLGSESEIICIIAGNVNNQHNVPVRVHDACFTSEVLGSLKCDCREQLHWSMDYIQQLSDTHNNSTSSTHTNGHTHNQQPDSSSVGKPHGGVIIYMPQEGRGIGLANKLKAYSLQTELGLDTVDANRALGFPDDARSYNCVPGILDSLNIKSIKLMTNNPRKTEVLRRLGVDVNGTIPVVVQPNSSYSKHYMQTKRNRMDHMMPDLTIN